MTADGYHASKASADVVGVMPNGEYVYFTNYTTYVDGESQRESRMKLVNQERVLIEVVQGDVLVDGKRIAEVFLEKTGYGNGTRIKGDLTIEWVDTPAVREETSPV